MLDKTLFRHAHTLSVRNYEVDWQGIVHNANYLLYCEVGRIEYLKHIGARLDLNAVNSSTKVVLVRNEIDYRKPARFDEKLTICTRIASVRNTSFVMEGLLLHADGEPVAENVAFHVWLDPKSDKPERVPDYFRTIVRAFEGDRCRFEENRV